MYRTIMFYVGKKSIVLKEQSFTLGELTAEILNISPDEYRQMKEILMQAEEEIKRCRDTKDIDHWRTANQHLLELDRQLCTYRIFRLLKGEPCMLCETESLLNTLSQKTFEGFNIVEEVEATQFQNVEYSWLAYIENCKTYRSILKNLASFNQTIRFFIDYYLSTLKKMDPDNYAAMLYAYLNDPRAAEKMIATPLNGGGLYSSSDPVMLSFVPRQVEPDVDEYQIFEYYEAYNLQTLLKMDFYRALGAGHVIRRCEYCGRYFLLTKGYHTKYCDQPNPKHPQFTCGQLGYRQTGLKEAAKDDPLKRSLFRCSQRLNKDVSRGNLTPEERDTLYEMALELHFDARQDPNISFEEFDRSLATQNLCRLCGISRNTGKVGRPKMEAEV